MDSANCLPLLCPQALTPEGDRVITTTQLRVASQTFQSFEKKTTPLNVTPGRLIGPLHRQLELARQSLAGSAYSDIRQTSVGLRNAGLVLEGQVRSYYFKQVAQELVMGSSHLTVHNHLVVETV